MSKTGPIILIEDDHDDYDLMVQALKELDVKNKVIWFPNPVPALEYLLTTSDQPFVIFCDINMPGLNGLEFKKKIDETPSLREKSIPFVYYTTTDDSDTISMAYKELTIQGFFVKQASYQAIVSDLKLVLEYWKRCRHPNSGK